MMSNPVTVQLPPELEVLKKKWTDAARGENEVIYSKEFGPLFTPLFSRLPLNGFGQDRPRFRALVSVLGLSWQPVALMAAWADPEVILVLGTDESLSARIDGEPVSEVIPRVSGIKRERFTFRRVAEADELQIYQEVRSFLGGHGIGYHEVAVDPTGGKKSMSVSAALAGFLSGAWIVYVDYAKYNIEKRIPEAGTEYPRLLRNPLEVFGELEFKRIKEAYGRGNYEEASHLAEDLSSRLYDNREAEALSFMAKSYGAWHQFDFPNAQGMLVKLKTHLERFARFGKWKWAEAILPKVRTQVTTTTCLAELTSGIEKGANPSSIQEGMPLILNHFAAAERYLSFHQFGVAILLTYATLERYVDLCLWADHGLDDNKPDFNKLSIDLARFDQVGREFHGKEYQKRGLPVQISLASGVQLLSALNSDLLPARHFGSIRGLMNHRNRCEFEHGLHSKVLGHDQVARNLAAVKAIIAPVIDQQGKTIDEELEQYRFPCL